MSEPYNPQEIEPKWQEQWDRDALYRAVIDESKPKFYALTMLPYPSGDIHIGHWYAMAPSDVRARYKRMQGTTFCSRWGLMPLDCPPRTPRSSAISIPKRGQWRTSPESDNNFAPWAR